jgi:hypothetical protein
VPEAEDGPRVSRCKWVVVVAVVVVDVIFSTFLGANDSRASKKTRWLQLPGLWWCSGLAHDLRVGSGRAMMKKFSFSTDAMGRKE